MGVRIGVDSCLIRLVNHPRGGGRRPLGRHAARRLSCFSVQAIKATGYEVFLVWFITDALIKKSNLHHSKTPLTYNESYFLAA